MSELGPYDALLANTVTFVGTLRRAGLSVSLAQTIRLARALRWIDLGSRDQVFDTACALLVTRQVDLRLFETLFDTFWRAPGGRHQSGPRVPPAPRHDAQPKRPFTIATYLAYTARRWAPEVDVVDRRETLSNEEALQAKDFGRMDAEELAAVRRTIAALRWQASERRTRRQQPARRGSRIDLRQALRQTSRLGSVPARLPRRRAKIKPRPVVLLADISGSMTTYSRLLLLFFYSVTRSLDQVESFAFGTRLTRLTPALTLRNVDRALEEAAHQVVDWEGGTRIADSLASFRHRWSKRLLNRGAVVVVVSDGCEPCSHNDDARRLGDEVARLRRRCHRLIWLNPRLGAPGYAPRVAGMAAALPAIDDFLPIHNLDSLHQLAAHLRTLPARRAGLRPGGAPQTDSLNRRLPA